MTILSKNTANRCHSQEGAFELEIDLQIFWVFFELHACLHTNIKVIGSPGYVIWMQYHFTKRLNFHYKYSLWVARLSEVHCIKGK